jgi:hypothetical protein
MSSETEMEVTSVTGVTMEEVVASLKSLDAAELFKVMKLAIGEVEKKMKVVSKAASKKEKKPSKKTGSMPKGQVPPQLRKPRAWVDFTLKHALEHGWESFTVFQTKKDKETGEKITEEIEMPGSIVHNGANVYDGSVTEKTPNGKQLIHKDAMSLSKQRWAPKENKGTHEELYREFESQYVEEDIETASETSSTTSSKVIKKTAAEKEAEKEAKKAAKEAEKEAKKAAKEAEKEAKKAAKEAEKEAKKAAKEEEKKKKDVPKAAVKKEEKKETEKESVAKKEEKKEVAVAKPTKKPVAKKEEWSCPADGMLHPWSYKGKNYLRNSDNQVWLRDVDGGCGDWQGIYMVADNRIDDSVPEPPFEEEE